MECLLTTLSPSRTGFRQTARQLPWRTWLSACSVPGTVDGRRTSIDERLRALGEQCFADVGERDMDGGQIEVECVRWGLFVGLFRSGCIPMPDTVQESLSWSPRGLVVAWMACVRSVFQSPAARGEECHRRPAFVPSPSWLVASYGGRSGAC